MSFALPNFPGIDNFLRPPVLHLPSKSTLVDYHAFGDVVWIIHLGSTENLDMHHHAVVHVSGVASNINKEDATFEIHTEQYLSATKTADNIFPVWCVPDFGLQI
ncbi:hypothetical protein B0H13DRAFT_2305278 [Mycena leptocephala]|nr:hypothetical protein B0H13DRAFT_2305278 [Mycena leptocephala]